MSGPVRELPAHGAPELTAHEAHGQRAVSAGAVPQRPARRTGAALPELTVPSVASGPRMAGRSRVSDRVPGVQTEVSGPAMTARNALAVRTGVLGRSLAVRTGVLGRSLAVRTGVLDRGLTDRTGVLDRGLAVRTGVLDRGLTDRTG